MVLVSVHREFGKSHPTISAEVLQTVCVNTLLRRGPACFCVLSAPFYTLCWQEEGGGGGEGSQSKDNQMKACTAPERNRDSALLTFSTSEIKQSFFPVSVQTGVILQGCDRVQACIIFQ